MRTTLKRICSLLLCLMMCLSLLPATVLADSTGDTTTPITITSASATVIEPVAGHMPSFTATVPEGANYTAEVTKWSIPKDGQYYNVDSLDLTNSSNPFYNYTFEGGVTCYAVVKFSPKDGYAFPSNGSDCTYQINDVTIAYNWSGIRAAFTVTGTGGGIETPTYSASIAIASNDKIELPAGYGESVRITDGKRFIVINNTGNRSLTLNASVLTLTGSGKDAFEVICQSAPSSLPAGNENSSSFYIRPISGLSSGTYKATINFQDIEGKITPPATATVTLVVGDHNWDETKWKSDGINHWHPCKDSGCTAHGAEAAHDTNGTSPDEAKRAKKATFETDGYTGDKHCSVCGRFMENGTVIPAGKYIRETRATMKPATLTAGMCGNGLMFASVEPEKYTVAFKSVGKWDAETEKFLIIPSDEAFVAGTKYRILFKFYANTDNGYTYDETHIDYWSTFTLNNEPTGYGVSVSGSTSRYIELTAGAASGATSYNVSFNANGGTGTMETVSGVSGSYTLPACGFTAPANKQFKAWEVDGTEYNAGATITVNANTVVKALWEVIPTYAVTVNNGTGGGSYAADAIVSIKANAPATCKAFDKWVVESGTVTLTNANSANTAFTMPAGAVTVKATYKDAHTYDGTWQKDATNHWHECTATDCPNKTGSKTDVATHTPGAAATETTPQTCTVCGYVIAPATGHTHSYTVESTTATGALKSAATCQSKAVYYKSCTCGDISTNEADTFTFGDFADHNYETGNNWGFKDASGHAHKCLTPGCTAHQDTVPHNWDGDQDTICNSCGYERTVGHSHTYDDTIWKYDDTNHWHECTSTSCPASDKGKKDSAAHVYDNDTDTTCNTCDYVRTIGGTDLTPVTAANFTISGYEVGKKITELSVSGTNTGLTTLGSYGTGYMICKDADLNDSVLPGDDETFAATTDYYLAVVLTAADGYTLNGLTADNVKLGTKTAKTVVLSTSDNTVGGAIFKLDQLTSGTPTPSHTHTYDGAPWEKDATNHWHECTATDCPNKTGSKTDVATHVYDDDNDIDCNICGYERTIGTPDPDPAPTPGGSDGSGKSGKSSAQKKEENFWRSVEKEIKAADPGEKLDIDTKSYDNVPWYVLEAIRQSGATVTFQWKGESDIVVPAEKAPNVDGQIFYPLADLAALVAKQPAAPVVNPETGGATLDTPLVQSKPAASAQTPAAQAPAAAQPEKAEAVQPAAPAQAPVVPESQPEEPQRSANGALAAGIAAAAALVAAGVWFVLGRKKGRNDL